MTTPIAHPSLRLQDIHPELNPAFSPNLFAYLKRKGHFYGDGGIAQGVFVVKSGKAAVSFGKGTQLIGYFDGNCFVGTLLIRALCTGAEASGGAYLIAPTDLEEVATFWENYLRVGRCAIDPKHQEYFLGDRYTYTAHGRKCQWCAEELAAEEAVLQ